jgi:hypothetical protein
VRIAAALGLVGVLGAGVVSTSGAALLRSGSPDTALRVAPWDAYALARAADRRATVTAPDSATAFRPIGDMARRAVTRDPTIATAWRTLGLVRAVSGDQQQAAALMGAAERISRRDLPTQLWLIEAAVNRNDIHGALVHYDTAMRTKPSSTGLLIPIMVGALDTPDVRPAIARLLAANPPWAGDFLYALAQRPPAEGATAALFRAMRSAGRVPAGAATDAVIPALVARRRFAEAAAVLAAVESRPTSRLRDGGFDQPGSYAPFDWQLGENELAGEVRSRPDRTDPALFADVGSSTAGVVAQQLTTLRPGRYQFRFHAGPSDLHQPDAIEWRLTCADAGSSIGQITVRLTTQGTQAHDFTVPSSNCPAQWLSLFVRSGSDPQGSGAWVDDVAIVPLGS